MADPDDRRNRSDRPRLDERARRWPRSGPGAAEADAVSCLRELANAAGSDEDGR